MNPIKLIVFVGSPGARTDFIAGWLGKLPEFVESSWSFDPKTGQSISSTQNTLSLDHPDNLKEFLQCHRYVLDPQASLTYVTKVHRVATDCKKIIDPNTVKLVPVSITGTDLNKIVWEGVIKSFARLHRMHTSQYVIDHHINKENITDADRINFLDQFLKKTFANKNFAVDEPNGIYYKDIFKKGGSYIVSDAIGIIADKIYHDLWDYMLPLADTPTTIVLWGHTFKLEDYIN